MKLTINELSKKYPNGVQALNKVSVTIPQGIFAEETTNKDGRRQTNPLYLKKHKLKNGRHTLTIKVKGKPVLAGIDPYNILIDRIPDDNTISVEL